MDEAGKRVYARGTEPDGIKFLAWYEFPNFVVEVTHPDGRVLTDKFPATWEPIYGPDVADVAQGEEMTDRLIKQLRDATTEGSE